MGKTAKPGMLDLFSGIGGFSLGFRNFTVTKAYCDNAKDSVRVLTQQMKAGALDQAPIFPDVTRLHVNDLPNQGRGIELITAGFPCQDISVAGKQAGLAKGARSSLYKQVFRLVGEFGSKKKRQKTVGQKNRLKTRFFRRLKERSKPSYLFMENVGGITSKKGEYCALLRALDKLGYDAVWDYYSAASVGACHRRKRWFLLAARRTPTPIALSPEKDAALEAHLTNCTKLGMSAVTHNDGEKQQAVASMALLGNAVVPAQANKAIRGLLPRLRDLQQNFDMKGHQKVTGQIPSPGAFIQGQLIVADADPKNVEPSCARGGPFQYEIKREKGEGFRNATPILYGKQTLKFLGTPRRNQARASAPTKRGLDDFGTGVAFCDRLAKQEHPRGALVKHTFTEEAMGFPRNWTADKDVLSQSKSKRRRLSRHNTA